MIRVHLPRELAAEYGAAAVQEVGPADPVVEVASVLAALGERLPGVAQRVLEPDGTIRPHLSIFVGGREVRPLGGAAAPVAQGEEVWILRAVSGGA